MLKKILAALAALGAGLSAIFYVLFIQAKDQREDLEKEVMAENAKRRADAEAAARKSEEAIAKKRVQLEAEDEKLNQRVHTGDGLDSFNAGIDLLRKQSERGNKRNTRAGGNGA